MPKINSKPGKPGVITGPATICPPINDTTYCINAVNGATSYQWSISGNSNPSLQILSGQGTTCVHVKIPSGYNGNQKIEVKAVNCAGKSSERVLEIKVFKKPATPGSINGFSSVCKSQIWTYSIGSISGATSYVWAVTGGAQIISGQGTTSVQVKFLNSSSLAVLSVYATNLCYNSSIRTKNISVAQNCKTSNGAIAETQNMSINVISVYPNPTSGLTTLSFNSMLDGKYNLKVFDVIGKVLISEDLSLSEGLNTKEINLQNVSHGVYFVTIISEGMEAQTLRIIVE